MVTQVNYRKMPFNGCGGEWPWRLLTTSRRPPCPTLQLMGGQLYNCCLTQVGCARAHGKLSEMGAIAAGSLFLLGLCQPTGNTLRLNNLITNCWETFTTLSRRSPKIIGMRNDTSEEPFLLMSLFVISGCSVFESIPISWLRRWRL